VSLPHIVRLRMEPGISPTRRSGSSQEAVSRRALPTCKWSMRVHPADSRNTEARKKGDQPRRQRSPHPSTECDGLACAAPLWRVGWRHGGACRHDIGDGEDRSRAQRGRPGIAGRRTPPLLIGWGKFCIPPESCMNQPWLTSDGRALLPQAGQGGLWAMPGAAALADRIIIPARRRSLDRPCLRD
jgi:hypothetical protein